MIHHETPAFADIAADDTEEIICYQLEVIEHGLVSNIERQVTGLRAAGCMFDEDDVRRLHEERYITQLELFANAVKRKREEFYGKPETV